MELSEIREKLHEMKRMKLWAFVAIIIFSAATLTGCKKEIPTGLYMGDFPFASNMFCYNKNKALCKPF